MRASRPAAVALILPADRRKTYREGVARVDNPKIGKMGLERAANMRWDGAVLAAERCAAAGGGAEPARPN